MSISDPNEPAAQASPTELDCAVTFRAHHEGEDGMGLRSMTVGRFEEIRRRLADGRGVREIARALGCSRDTVREVRDGVRQSPDAPTIANDPLWMQQVNWLAVIHDLGLGHPLKFIWEEKAQVLTTYSNFWKQFYRKFPQYRQADVTAREFELLRYLANHSERAVAREELLANVWRISPDGLPTRTIDMHVARLREKLRDDSADPKVLLTVRGKGYMFKVMTKH